MAHTKHTWKKVKIKKPSEISVPQFFDDSKVAGAVLLGIVAGKSLSKVTEKIITKNQVVSGLLGLNGANTARILKPLTSAATGLIIQQSTDNDYIRFFGTGMVVQGGFMATKDFLKIDILQGVDDNDALTEAINEPISIPEFHSSPEEEITVTPIHLPEMDYEHASNPDDLIEGLLENQPSPPAMQVVSPEQEEEKEVILSSNHAEDNYEVEPGNIEPEIEISGDTDSGEHLSSVHYEYYPDDNEVYEEELDFFNIP